MRAIIVLAAFTINQVIAASTRKPITIVRRAGEGEPEGEIEGGPGEGGLAPADYQPAAYQPEEQREGGIVLPLRNFDAMMAVIEQHEALVANYVPVQAWAPFPNQGPLKFNPDFPQHKLPEEISYELVGRKRGLIVPGAFTPHDITFYLTKPEAAQMCAKQAAEIRHKAFNLYKVPADQGTWKCQSFDDEHSDLEQMSQAQDSVEDSYLRPLLGNRPVWQTTVAHMEVFPRTIYVDTFGWPKAGEHDAKFVLVDYNRATKPRFAKKASRYLRKDLALLDALKQCADFATNNQPLEDLFQTSFVDTAAKAFNLIEREQRFECVTYGGEISNKKDINVADNTILKSVVYTLEDFNVNTSIDKIPFTMRQIADKAPYEYSLSANEGDKCKTHNFRIHTAAPKKLVNPSKKVATRFMAGTRSLPDTLRSCARLTSKIPGASSFNLFKWEKENQWVCNVFKFTQPKLGSLNVADDTVGPSYVYVVDRDQSSCSVM